MRAYYFDNSEADPRDEHDSGTLVGVAELERLGVQYTKLTGSAADKLRQVDELCAARSYKNRDSITVSPAHLPEYETKIQMFFREHIHEDEEIRCVVEGRGFFDVRDAGDRWVRIAVEADDLLVLPAGIYHRFTVDRGNHLKALRLFKEDPKWTPINRPDADANPFHIAHLQSLFQ
ncbi:1,2-dihydroxy-3-keto-5-methylthiopentene dioxygenase [Coemansia spiralis]|uniref:Acireductone dioxygenase n=2 Tax=Coemansia TaxID=4863 RepID=A0A9W8G7R8_9FUNG|nr:1,2-dihydroxy-3-keto-5-methylthiopentene dioxygenase-like protein [Coemansia spiralis]KAJ1990997.1 1,2-dihydroxy-3-keto-5-methylthiopentene dioxygenase [Coemansia umbellata]KAJ2621007.1 1,2-dihydroxy-3-keto-5-methylthiopentene dioxygenase [Coemansia sp. RSA 1358]KAJ2675756.1 1,2-dihydroxy-3-keto-5-methylthiopentene dioxygenase [Coemansia spiralis]